MADKGVKLDARSLPFPRSVSAEAQAVLRGLVNDDGVPLNSLHVMPAIDDRRAWLAVKAMVERHYLARAATLDATLRSQVETLSIGSTTVHVATPAVPHSEAALVDLHGGAFVFGGGEACRVSARMQADQHGVRCYGVDYRMPPEYPYPAALDDCLTAYRHVLERHDAASVAIIGRSAGGNLAAAMLLRARAEGLPFPAALVLLSPEVDLTESGDSFQLNQMADVVLPGSLMQTILLYAKGADLGHPYLSPLFGDLTGFPPTFLQSGTRDLFLSNTVRMHRALRAVGVSAELHVFEAMPHGGFMGEAQEDLDLLGEIRQFIRQHLRLAAD
jgi:acetyl esterase/lipase